MQHRWNIWIPVCLLMLSGLAIAEDPEPGVTPERVERVKARAAAIASDLIAIRRQIHANPELSGREERTAALVAERLKELGLKVTTGVGGHGVVGLLEGAKASPIVAYRADMDAVRSEVVGDVPYKSRVPGVKHVCGHDAHVAIGLGVADILASLGEDLPGSVKFIFQPAEENVQGARAMIADGVLENPAPRAIYAIHTAPYRVGSVVFPVGVGLTGWDSFTIALEGKGREKIEALIRGRLEALNNVEPFTGPEAFETLLKHLLIKDGPLAEFVLVQLRTEAEAGRQVIQGQIRAAGQPVYDRARRQVGEIVEAAAGGPVRVTLEWNEDRFPDMHSDPALVLAAVAPVEAAVGKGAAIMMHASAPFFGEDFALFQQEIPGAMLLLGVANPERDIRAFNHFPDYDIDEASLEVGATAMASVLLDYLATH